MYKKVLIIAEAGVNHNGNFELAKELIGAASEAGADYVKFQTFKTHKLVSRVAKKAGYQLKGEAEDYSQMSMLEKLEMPLEWYSDLFHYATSRSIGFLSTGFDEESIDFLLDLGIPLFKIPSGEITNKPFLQHVARKEKPIILSTGMATMAEVKAAIEVLVGEGLEKDMITVLHCNTEYPTPMRDVNLLAMKTIERNLQVKVGYSDHTLGIEVPIAAVALGAEVIEKHFTLDRSFPGPDHGASLQPRELKDMVDAIRNVEEAISGEGIKEPSPSESKNMSVARKSIHLRKDVNPGDILKIEDLIMLRPGDGISPMDVEKVIGKEVIGRLNAGDKLNLKDLK